MTTNTLSLFAGFGIANSFRHYKLTSDEVKQGKNYYFSAIPLTLQYLCLARLNGRLISYIPSMGARIVAHGLSGISVCLSLPTALFLACVKHSHYTELTSIYDDSVPKLKKDYKKSYASFFITKLPNRLPAQLSDRTLKVVHFLADHAGDMMQTAMVLAGVGLSILGQTFFARGLLAGLTYGILDSRGWIPRKISLFTETYVSSIGSIGMLYTGTWLDRVYAIISLVSSILPRSHLLIQNKLDSSTAWLFNYANSLIKTGPPIEDHLLTTSLEEIDKSFNGSRNLTYAEIRNVIDEKEYFKKYEINVPHCTNFVRAPNLPKDHDFSKLLQFFKAIDWTQKFDLIKAKLSKEDRFIDFLQEKYIDVPKEKLKKNTDDYIELLAKKESISKEEYAAKWVQEQMSALVNILTGSKQGKGSQQDLQDAINICPEIVAYLQQMSERVNDKVEYEDALLKLALEAGNYCNRGIKRAFNEMQTQVIYKDCLNDDPLKQYELKLLQSLQNLRYEIILKMYQETIVSLYPNNDLFQDTHAFDLYRKFFAFGFYPFTEYERKDFSMSDLIMWKVRFKPALELMHNEYQNGLSKIIKKNGNEAKYIQHKIIDQNPNLNIRQREELRNWYADIEGTGNSAEIQKKSRYLLLMTLGVLQPPMGNS